MIGLGDVKSKMPLGIYSVAFITLLLKRIIQNCLNRSRNHDNMVLKLTGILGFVCLEDTF